MSYEGISVKAALDSINKHNGGWYLPQIQRQYVWGARDESEDYICLLLDSIMRGYPIGGIVLWKTETPVPHREFLTDYKNAVRASEVEQGLWTRDKYLVYDGQQRLQTLFSSLRHTIHGRVLCFDLLFDKDKHETDETGFYFIDQGSQSKKGSIRMNSLCVNEDDSKSKEKLKDTFVLEMNYSDDVKLTIKANLDKLWETFVQQNSNALAYFKVQSKSDKEVNEIFRRLNTGGVALTQTELVLSKIKAKYSSFEGDLDTLSGVIFDASKIEFTPAEILQFIFLIAKESPRVDSDRIKNDGDVDLLKNLLSEVSKPLKDFFESYLYGLLNINDSRIIPRKLALLPIMAYINERYKKNDKYEIKRIPFNEIKLIHQYFILSQLNDWNTQTMITSFVKEARQAAAKQLSFPLDKIRNIATEKTRVGYLTLEAIKGQPWLALKIITPNRQYQFASTKPQIDHIFPRNLEGKDEIYKSNVDVLWNFQPTPAGINNYKRAKHPLTFFKSEEGSKYYEQYDFLPQLDSELWNDEVQFISVREQLMINALDNLYGLKLGNVEDQEI